MSTSVKLFPQNIQARQRVTKSHWALKFQQQVDYHIHPNSPAFLTDSKQSFPSHLFLAKT